MKLLCGYLFVDFLKMFGNSYFRVKKTVTIDNGNQVPSIMTMEDVEYR